MVAGRLALGGGLPRRCACSSTGQSGRLVTAGLQVPVLPGASMKSVAAAEAEGGVAGEAGGREQACAASQQASAPKPAAPAKHDRPAWPAPLRTAGMQSAIVTTTRKRGRGPKPKPELDPGATARARAFLAHMMRPSGT